MATMARAATLEYLSMDDMIAKATDVVRCRVSASWAGFKGTPGRGGMIYTHYSAVVLERWKGSPSVTMDVAVPGGTAQGYRQTFTGSPELQSGEEYVLFLWTSRSGVTQILGLTQGLFTINTDASGSAVANRAPATEIVVDRSTGRPISDSGFSLGLGALKKRVLASSGPKAAQ